MTSTEASILLEIRVLFNWIKFVESKLKPHLRRDNLLGILSANMMTSVATRSCGLP